jgi:hypothetical protein
MIADAPLANRAVSARRLEATGIRLQLFRSRRRLMPWLSTISLTRS